MTSYTQFLSEQANRAAALGERAESSGFSKAKAVGISSVTAAVLGAWGIIADKKTGWYAIVPSLAITFGSIGTTMALSKHIGLTTDSPLENENVAYGLLGLTLLINIAISSQNIDRSKELKDDEEKTRFSISLIALFFTLVSVIGMGMAKLGKKSDATQ